MSAACRLACLCNPDSESNWRRPTQNLSISACASYCSAYDIWGGVKHHASIPTTRIRQVLWAFIPFSLVNQHRVIVVEDSKTSTQCWTVRKEVERFSARTGQCNEEVTVSWVDRPKRHCSRKESFSSMQKDFREEKHLFLETSLLRLRSKDGLCYSWTFAGPSSRR